MNQEKAKVAILWEKIIIMTTTMIPLVSVVRQKNPMSPHRQPNLSVSVSPKVGLCAALTTNEPLRLQPSKETNVAKKTEMVPFRNRLLDRLLEIFCTCGIWRKFLL